MKEVYPDVRVPVEVSYGDFSEFAGATGVPMSARGQGVFQRISFGRFFANDTDDSCLLSLEFARRLTDGKPESLVGKDVTFGYAAASAPAREPRPACPASTCSAANAGSASSASWSARPGRAPAARCSRPS